MSFKKSISIVLLIFSFSTVLKAQEIITTSGSFDTQNNCSVSWTVGEPVTETISDGSGTLTQGFQQSKLIISTEIMEPEKNTAFTYSKFEDIHIRFYETGILLRRGPLAEPTWFNSFRDITIFVCKNGINIDDNGYSVNTCFFENIIIEDVGGWSGENGIILSGYGHCFTGVYVGLPGGNAAVKFLTTTGNNVLIRIYGESSMTYLIDLGTPTPGIKNTLIAPHVDSMSMILTSIPNDPDLTIIPTF